MQYCGVRSFPITVPSWLGLKNSQQLQYISGHLAWINLKLGYAMILVGVWLSLVVWPSYIMAWHTSHTSTSFIWFDNPGHQTDWYTCWHLGDRNGFYKCSFISLTPVLWEINSYLCGICIRTAPRPNIEAYTEITVLFWRTMIELVLNTRLFLWSWRLFLFTLPHKSIHLTHNIP